MTDKPNASARLALPSLEEQRLEQRDRAIAMSVAAQMVERFFNPESIVDAHSVRLQMTRAAEFAAYEAIQQDRAHHAEDMKVLEQFAKVQLDMAMLKPQPVFIPADK